MLLELNFLILLLLFILVFCINSNKNKKVLIISLIWISLIGVLSYLKYFENVNTTPPRFLLVLVGNFVFIYTIYKLLQSNKLEYKYSLIIHSLRVTIEIILLFLYFKGEIPSLMTFHGWNFDIIIGISALILLFVFIIFKIKPSKTFLLIWNYLGLLFLLNIVSIAILSAPLPIQQFAFNQPNIAVLKFPFILLPSFIVPIVFLTHILSIKNLKSK